MRRQNLIERLGAVVHGEADVTHEPVGLRLRHVVPHVVLVELDRARATQVVQQVVVDVVDPQPLKGGGQARLGLLLAGAGPGQALRGQGIGVARVAFHERLAQSRLRGAVVVDEGGVHIGAALGDELVHHGLQLLDVDGRHIIGISQGQAHGTEAELRHAVVRCGHEFSSQSLIRRIVKIGVGSKSRSPATTTIA